MTIPTSINDLSTTASSNSPSGSESPVDGDNYIRALSSFIATIRDQLNGTSDTGVIKNATSLTVAGNTTLGDASTDTLNVGNGGIIKDANGIVGIRTTPNAWVASSDAIEMYRGSFGSLRGGPVGHAFVASNAYGTGNVDPGFTTWKFTATGASALYEQIAGAHIWYYATGTAAGSITWTTNLVLATDGNLRPGVDATQALGHASYRWSVVYAATGTINTSDARDKEGVVAMSVAEKAVGQRCKALMKRYRFQDALAAKGDRARIHFGIQAQDVRDAFLAEGLNPRNYGVFCEDTWYERTVNGRIEVSEDASPGAVAKSRFGIRYEELLALIVASS
jgi:hypothetical protein